MKDIFRQEIIKGDVVIYPARRNGQQIINFGIVIDSDYLFGTSRKIVVRHLAQCEPSQHYYKMAVKPTHLTAHQVLAVKDTNAYPKSMIDYLQKYYVLFCRQQMTKAEQSKEKKTAKKISPAERYRRHIQTNIDAGLYDNILDDPLLKSA